MNFCYNMRRLGTVNSLSCIVLFLVVHIDLVHRFVAESLKETLLGRQLVNMGVTRGEWVRE